MVMFSLLFSCFLDVVFAICEGERRWLDRILSAFGEERDDWLCSLLMSARKTLGRQEFNQHDVSTKFGSIATYSI